MEQLIFASQNRYDYYEGTTPKLNRGYIIMIQNLQTISFRLRSGLCRTPTSWNFQVGSPRPRMSSRTEGTRTVLSRNVPSCRPLIAMVISVVILICTTLFQGDVSWFEITYFSICYSNILHHETWKLICSFRSRKMFHWLFYNSNWDSLI